MPDRSRAPGIGRLQAIVDMAQGGFVYVDRDERIRSFSRGAEALFGMSAGSTVGRTIRETTKEGFYEQHRLHIRRALDGEVVTYDRVLLRPDGGRRVIRARLVPDRASTGEVRGYLGHFIDVSDLKDVEDALAASEARFADFARASGDWLWENGLDGRLTWLSESVERMTGMPASWFIGRRPEELAEPVDGPDAPDWESRMRLRAERRPYRDFRYLLKLPSGSRWISNSAVPRFDADGGFAGYRGTTTDITRQVQLEQARRAALQDLDAFAYSVSHDLSAPARAIAGFAGMLIADHGPSLPAEALRLLGRIDAAGRTMGEMIDGLLALARSARVELKRESVDLGGLARAVWAETSPLDVGRGPTLRTPERLHVWGDRVLLHSLLLNLLGNARKYARDVDDAYAEVRAEPEGVYAVCDNGIGFDMAHARRLFAPFTRLHADPRYEGSGIGLAIAKRVVERHGGRIWAQAEPGQGAIIRFTLGELDERSWRSG